MEAIYIFALVCLACLVLAIYVFSDDSSSSVIHSLCVLAVGAVIYSLMHFHEEYVYSCDDFDYSKRQVVIGTIQSVVLDSPETKSHYSFSVCTKKDQGQSNTIIPIGEKDLARYVSGDLVVFQCTKYYDASDDSELYREYSEYEEKEERMYSCELSFLSEEQGKKKYFLRAKDNHNKTFILELPQELGLCVSAEITVTVRTYGYADFETICLNQLPGYIFSQDGSILHIEPRQQLEER